MKKIPLLLLNFIISYNAVFSQTCRNNTEESIKKAQQYLQSKYWTNIDSIQSFLFKDLEEYYEDSIIRQIDFGHWQICFRTHDYGYSISYFIQGQGKHAYLFIVTEECYEDQKTNIVCRKTDDQYLLQYLGLHNCLYQSNYNLSNFSVGSFKRFGTGCGGAGSATEIVLTMYDCVARKDRQNILRMATSLVPEERTIGAMGLYFLKKLGIVLTAIENDLIQMAQRSSIRIIYCSGCTIRESEQMSTFLTNAELDGLFEWMKNFFNSNPDE